MMAEIVHVDLRSYVIALAHNVNFTLFRLAFRPNGEATRLKDRLVYSITLTPNTTANVAEV